MKNNEGFTLIELLTIIIILSIISVITVPIVLNVIDKSKKGAAIDSAFGYVNGVNKFYVTNFADGLDFSDGVYLVQTLSDMGLEVNGMMPTGNSWVWVKNHEVYDFCLKFGDYVVSFDPISFDATASRGSIEERPL